MTSAGEVLANAGSLLLGRRTYEDFRGVWPKRSKSPYKAFLDGIQKYVASNTLKEPLPWKNSTLLKGDAADSVAGLRKKAGKDMVVMGSGQLIQSLMRRNLVDKYVLLIHPIVLGSGRHLFTHPGAFASLRLVKSKTTDKGVIIAAYEPAQ
jgi:dihydrofolate reductase